MPSSSRSSRPRDQTQVSYIYLLHGQADSLSLIPPGKPRHEHMWKLLFSPPQHSYFLCHKFLQAHIPFSSVPALEILIFPRSPGSFYWGVVFRTTHSSVLARRISGTAESGGLPSMGSHRVGHD